MAPAGNRKTVDSRQIGAGTILEHGGGSCSCDPEWLTEYVAERKLKRLESLRPITLIICRGAGDHKLNLNNS